MADTPGVAPGSNTADTTTKIDPAVDNRKTRSRRRRARRTPKKKVEAAPGFITIDARPWARVTIGGKDYGVTPVKDIEWPRGSVRIVLERKDLGVTRKETIVVKSGEHTRRRFAME